jgi:hypothetical protein
MTYNLTFAENATDLIQVATGVNTASGGWLFGGLMFFVFVLIFIVFRDTDVHTLFVGDSFITSILAGLLLFAGLISPWMAAIPVVMLAVSLFIKLWN